MSKLGADASKRLVQLLYKTTSTEIAPKLAYITKYLYEHQQQQPQKSLLDDLTENQWKQKPLIRVVDEKLLQPFLKSNILKFKCHNGYINNDNFHNLFPINRERKYNIDGDNRKTGFEFYAIKSRNPVNLIFEGFYYLIFKNYIEAAVYYIETKNKLINGVNLHLEFIDVNESELKHMVSPYLGSDISNKMIPHLARTPTGKMLFPDFLKHTPKKLNLVNKILKLPKNDYNSLDQFNNFQLLINLIELNSRKSCVLVKNLPFDMKKSTLLKLLWDYKLAEKEPIIPLILDPSRETSLYLFRFQNVNCATRFMRNYHGKRWNTINHEKKLYEPILCEIID